MKREGLVRITQFNMATMNRILASQTSLFALNKTVSFPNVSILVMCSFGFIYSLILFCFYHGLQLAGNVSSCSCLLRRCASSLSADKKSLIAEGPSLGEFISGEVSPQENPYRRKKGQRYIPAANV